jgi:uncharacterized membrane protein
VKSEYKKYIIVMVLCFIVGGSSIILFSFQAYESLLRQSRFSERFINNTTENENRSDMFSNSEFFRQPGRETMPLENFYSPQSLMLLFSGLVLLAAGVSVWMLTREKEITSEKEKIKSLLLLPEERLVISELKRNKGNMTQSQLVKNTGMSKVKTHRIVNRLSSKGIIKKYPYGLTNKIVLEKEI